MDSGQGCIGDCPDSGRDIGTNLEEGDRSECSAGGWLKQSEK